MNYEDDDIKELLNLTTPELTTRESEFIRRGVWRKIERHKTAVKVRTTLAATAAVIIIAVIATIGTHEQIAENEWISVLSEDELMEEIATAIPSEQITTELLQQDGNSISDAIIADADIEDAVATLSNEQQEELLLALSEFESHAYY